MIFVTVGTQFCFDSLIRAVEKAVESNLIEQKILAQIGNTNYQPSNFNSMPKLSKEEFDYHVKQSQGIISHAGMGSITSALENNKPLLVMPRLKKYKEVVNDHQLYIAREYEKAGYLMAAYDQQEFFKKIVLLNSFKPRKRNADIQQVKIRINSFLDRIVQV